MAVREVPVRGGLVADAGGVDPRNGRDPPRLELPAALVLEQDAPVPGLRGGVGDLQVVAAGEQQVGLAVAVEVGHEQPGTAEIEVHLGVERPPAEPAPAEVLEGDDLLVLLGDDRHDV